MTFVFLSHWGAERMATTERLAGALARKGHRVLHAVAPVRNPWRAFRYGRIERPIRSIQLWSPVARLGVSSGLDAWLAAAEIRLVGGPFSVETTVVLQSPWLEPVARRLDAGRRIYAAVDEVAEVDSGPACRWADAVFCLSEEVRTALEARHPGRPVRNLGQCGRSVEEFDAKPDPDATIVYAGGAHVYVLPVLLRSLAKLPARLLLVGLDRNAAKSVFGTPVPRNVEALGWLSGSAYSRAIARGWVGVVPYDPDHPRVRQSNPDKPYDYLLGGLCAITTPVPALERVAGVSTVQSFELVDAVRAALTSYGPGIRERQRAVGREHSADRYAERFLAFLDGTKRT
jgi:hypothetical protein